MSGRSKHNAPSDGKPEEYFKIHEVKALKKMPLPQEATDLLYRLVQVTKPLIIRQRWRVGQLIEFYPSNGSLLGLNVNRGTRIMIRLRDSRNSQRFLPWDSLLGTLVHELVHNVIGEHSFEFYEMVDKLSDEVQNDVLQGKHLLHDNPFSWDNSKGKKLGGDSQISRLLLPDAKEVERARQARLLAFDKAAKSTSVNTVNTSSNSKPLTTEKSIRSLPSADVIVDFIGERRSRDRQTCSAGTDSAITVSVEETETWLAAADIVDLTSPSSSSPIKFKVKEDIQELDYCAPCDRVGNKSSYYSSFDEVIDLSRSDSSPNRSVERKLNLKRPRMDNANDISVGRKGYRNSDISSVLDDSQSTVDIDLTQFLPSQHNDVTKADVAQSSKSAIATSRGVHVEAIEEAVSDRVADLDYTQPSDFATSPPVSRDHIVDSSTMLVYRDCHVCLEHNVFKVGVSSSNVNTMLWRCSFCGTEL